VAGSPEPGEGQLCFGSEDGAIHALPEGEEACRRIADLRVVVKSPPEVDGADLFVASLDGRVMRRRLDGTTGAEWEAGLGAVVLGGVTASGDAVYSGTVAGKLFCLDRETGAVRWVFTTEGKIVARPVARDGTVYVASLDGRLYAVVE
jgi:outer membrane protein assembly factor BamB